MDDKRFSCDRVVPIEQEPRHHLIIENEFVRAFSVEIALHDRTLCHHHPHEYLLYVVGDGEIVSAARDEEPKKLSYRDGECELLEAGMVHVVENLSDGPFRNVVVELLPGTDSLLRGPDPNLIAQEAEVAQLFEETNMEQLLENERAAIFSIAIKPRVEVGISGPAVVAMPYGTKLPLNYFGDIEVKRNSTCYLAWIPPHEAAILWGCWEKPERAIIFQIGRTDEQGVAVLKLHDPVRSLRAHADESEWSQCRRSAARISSAFAARLTPTAKANIALRACT